MNLVLQRVSDCLLIVFTLLVELTFTVLLQAQHAMKQCIT